MTKITYDIVGKKVIPKAIEIDREKLKNEFPGVEFTVKGSYVIVNTTDDEATIKNKIDKCFK